MNILEKIVRQRRERIRTSGHDMGQDVPARRQVPLVPFPRDPFIICEVKRRSPSAGEILDLPDPHVQVEKYAGSGIPAVSVLTETDFFGGSLKDLISLKKSFPDVCFLRKDFLFDPEDIEISWRAGADAVLLIAAILEDGQLEMLYRIAAGYGLEVLLEVHTPEEIERVRSMQPATIGINARNLEDFSVDLLTPVMLSHLVDWNPRMIFESGIKAAEDAAVAFSAGFDAVLVGEAVMRQPELLSALQRARKEFTERSGRRESSASNPADSFWGPLCRRRLEYRINPDRGKTACRPLVKICGITREEDARLADELGADILGFVFAPSPRRADPAVVRQLGNTEALKVAVVVLNSAAPGLPPEVNALMKEGFIDAVQFHGDETPDACYSQAFPYYKALRIRDRADIARITAYRSPRVLTDA
ncbi:MAG: bifunctional indole-3-glycerol phosphate synthase/phosphoribosylanthranilate isomerase, partial [Spirochaetota bacterium]|nr:bifunctional indole-3-glycerol phosphate synthase/phosphoribosylanthranilate isomerase [Spirochaetota bacterium]